ncbi:hypothetical protein [Pontibacter sp. G13]|uniref:hypothetical protein n=1 Tax=Pontibacter sp. G13 TaxID=3074898 RepID=UPI00288A6D1A|nr:hypothetical protein [Pontibacter sp. G13]WNJ19362.1 hypothetical protein RJD25_02620 [Pontibacter sp. G13]
MESNIYSLIGKMWKSVTVHNGELWVSNSKRRSIEKFSEAVQKTGMMKSAYAWPYDRITAVSFNTASSDVEVSYLNEKDKEKSYQLEFLDEEEANQFGNFLGKDLGYGVMENKEPAWKPLGKSLLYIASILFLTIMGATVEDPSELGENSRNGRAIGKILALITDVIGQTGLIIVGVLASLVIGFFAFKRFKNPAQDVTYSQSLTPAQAE